MGELVPWLLEQVHLWEVVLLDLRIRVEQVDLLGY